MVAAADMPAPPHSISPSAQIMAGAFIDEGVVVRDHVRVGPNAVLLGANGQLGGAEAGGVTVIQDGAVIGANATVLPGLLIGASAIVGAGAVVTKNVPAFAVVVGNPATIVSYQTPGSASARRRRGESTPESELGKETGSRLALGVGGCHLWRLPHFSDVRGDLYPMEFERDLPFVPRRTFFAHGVASNGNLRGEHAHRECRQFLISARGSLSVVVDDGTARCEVALKDPSIGLDLMPMVWAIQYKFSPGTVLLVMASHPYDERDYIRDYEEFRSLVAGNVANGA